MLRGFNIAKISNRTVLLLLLAFALIASFGSLAINFITVEGDFLPWAESWLQNFSTEMFGAFLTFILVEMIIGGRQKREEREASRIELQADAMVQLKAAQSIRERQTLIDRMKTTGLLQGADLSGLNLQKIRFEGANLEGAKLNGAVLTGARLDSVNLRGAQVQDAYLIAVTMRYAHCEGADFQRARLSGSNLQETSFTNCNLWGVTFQGANLTHA